MRGLEIMGNETARIVTLLNDTAKHLSTLRDTLYAEVGTLSAVYPTHTLVLTTHSLANELGRLQLDFVAYIGVYCKAMGIKLPEGVQALDD